VGVTLDKRKRNLVLFSWNEVFGDDDDSILDSWTSTKGNEDEKQEESENSHLHYSFPLLI
jgi:hypothetical protein